MSTNIKFFDHYLAPAIQADATPVSNGHTEQTFAIRDARNQLSYDYFKAGLLDGIDYIKLQLCLYALLSAHDTKNPLDPSSSYGGTPLEAAKWAILNTDLQGAVDLGKNTIFEGHKHQRVLTSALGTFPISLLPLQVFDEAPETLTNSSNVSHVSSIIGSRDLLRSIQAAVYASVAGRMARQVFETEEYLSISHGHRPTLLIPGHYNIEDLAALYKEKLTRLDLNNYPEGRNLGALILMGIRERLNDEAQIFLQAYESERKVRTYTPWALARTVMLSAFKSSTDALALVNKYTSQLPNSLRLGTSNSFKVEMAYQLTYPDPERLAAAFLFLIGSDPNFYAGPNTVSPRQYLPENFESLAPVRKAAEAIDSAEVWIAKLRETEKRQSSAKQTHEELPF